MFNTLTRMGAAGAGGTYEIEKSLRFNPSDDTYLSRTFGTNSSNTTKTFSFWVKRSSRLGDYTTICATTQDGNIESRLQFANNGAIKYTDRDSGDESTDANFYTVSLYRDCSAWYHVVLIIDTTNGTAGDRIRIYVNGDRVTSLTSETQPSQNYAVSFMRSSAVNFIGVGAATGSDDFSGYLAEMHFLDGTIKEPSHFGKTDADTGQWIPQEYTGGGYGNNGFYLDFKDNSGTTATTLGKDSSGQGNNWTPNNFSVATDDEIACDSFSDTPTNNWCTMNINNNPNGATLNNGGLEVNLVYPHDDNGVYATFGVTSGKWYWEAKCTSAGNRGQVGVTDAGHKSGSNSGYNYSVATRHTGGTGDTSGTSNSNLDAVIDSGNWVTFCFDADNGQIWYSREAAPNISGTANVTGLTLGPGRSWQPHIRETGNPVSNFTFNFGASAAGFKYGPPNDDYKALNTANLPEPTIKKGSDHFNTKLYTGNSSTNAITGVGFAPNLVWVKNRVDTDWHALFDTVRGVQKPLYSAHSDIEDSVATSLTAFDSDGFTLGAHGNANQNTEAYVSWNWKESATAGFDIVSYSGTGSARTVSHSLGVAPEMMMIKNRSANENWIVYHAGIASDAETDYIILNSTGAAGDDTWLNDTAPTSSQWEYSGGGATFNNSGNDYIAYLFASVEGYSKAGSYKGNGNADGTFVYTGFKPAFVLIKSSSHTESWEIYDNKRLGYNVDNNLLLPNLDDAEYTEDRVDLLSNGFKARINSGGINGSGKTYIYLAIAETPFKYANAR
ncbi:virion structural protein [Cyanophage SS120-1]|uniref:DUF7483 domain-containing protein n=1 Tax=Cyanophage SS120-1 TaxID=616674 RepID=M1T360_9CAUD|nr:virion structural protein [Cyanophage SS120-1]AGG54530.1 hypothetical protein CYYG_00029 [Cyanophage SS120-1]